jgi:DNA primase
VGEAFVARIRQEDIEAVRERTDVVKVISQYLTLKKAGHDSMVGLCPFHTEKTPSLSVSPSKQVYYCFGCHAGGDAVKFIREVESLSFMEAIERLAKEAGVTIRYEAESPGERRAASRRQALHRANAEAAALYHRMLLDGREGADARSYLAGRGIGQESAREFQIGYAPLYPDFLLRRLSGRFSPEILVEAGLALRDAAGGVRDRFRGRVVFPIHDLAGQAVGFGARLQSGDGPKYLNSPETPVYHKGRVLYNLHRARGAITRSGEAYVVEGYTDVIALDQAGVPTGVATCGTALGEEHFQLLSRFAERVVLAFDSDEAGARAAERAYAFHERFPLQVLVLVLPEGLDPADFVRTHGREAFSQAAEGAVPLVEYMIGRVLAGRDLNSVEGRAAAVRAGLPIVAGLADRVRRQEYAHLLAERAGVSSSSVLLELERMEDRDGSTRTTGVTTAGPRTAPQQKAEWEMLKLLAQSDGVFESQADRLGEEHFERALHRRLFTLLKGTGGQVQRLVAETDDERVAGPLAALATEPVEGELTVAHASRVALSLEEYALKRRIDTLRKRLERLNPIKDPDYEPLFEELVDLEGSRRRVRAEAERV